MFSEFLNADGIEKLAILSDFISIDLSLTLYYLVDFLIAITILSAMRFLAGTVANVSATHEISQKDNNAFGVSLAGAMVAVSIMLMGVVSGDAGFSLLDETQSVLYFGILGIILMWITRIIFDRLSFPKLSIQQQIMQGNMAASIIDACNMIATAIIIKGAMTWVDGGIVMAFIAVAVSFLASQIIMALATLYRVKVYAKRHNGDQLHSAIEQDNVALSLRFGAYRVGIAIAVSSAFTVIEYIPEDLAWVFVLWFIVAMVLFVILTLVAITIRLGVLFRVNIAEEVGEQRNISVGVIEGSIYIVVGLLISGVIGS
jgi:uncharacterized membrane protein YjfL (UPF0719 family)